MRRLLLALLLVTGFAFGQVTTSPSITGVPAPQSSVAITGGAINGATVGSTTPAAGAFTTLTSSGATSHSTTLAVGGTTLNSSPAAQFQVNGSSGAFFVRTNGAEAYFTLNSDNYFGCNVSGCKLNLLSGAGSTAITISGTGAVAMPGLASSSAATTGTVCWTTSTGNLNVDTTTTCLLSARKYKQDIKPLNRGISEVMALRPVSYQLRPEYNPEKLGRQVGFIADEVQKVDDRFVSMDEHGEAHAVRYQQMVALLVSGMQEQQKQIRRLERKLKLRKQ
jgi:hypothetical protein